MHSITIILLITLVASSKSIKCYQETITGDAASAPQTEIACDANIIHCMKTEADIGDAKTIVRKCGSTGACQRTGCTTASGRTVCCCEESLCNGAVSNSFALALFTPIFLFLLHSFEL